MVRAHDLMRDACVPPRSSMPQRAVPASAAAVLLALIQDVHAPTGHRPSLRRCGSSFGPARAPHRQAGLPHCVRETKLQWGRAGASAARVQIEIKRVCPGPRSVALTLATYLSPTYQNRDTLRQCILPSTATLSFLFLLLSILRVISACLVG